MAEGKQTLLQDLSQKNGEINRMDEDALRQQLQKYQLPTAGSKDVLRRRLKERIKKDYAHALKPKNDR